MKSPNNKVLFDDEYIKRLLEVDTSGQLVISLQAILKSQHDLYVKECIIFAKDDIKSLKEYSDFSKSSHKMKSSYGNMGLVELSQIAKNFENEYQNLSEKINISAAEKAKILNQVKPFFNSFFECEKKSFLILDDVIQKFKQVA